MKKLLPIILCLSASILTAQQWMPYNPTFNIDLNAIYVLGPGAIAGGGGQETNDSFQIMVHTDDYGQSWVENEHDGLAPWNKSIAFSDLVNGFGVGNDGRIIQSNDGGLHWGFATYPVNRDFNKIVNVNAQTYFIAGGNRSNDSIQTIVKTTDGGANWVVVYDQPGPWLKSIFFTDTLHGIAVGDSGVILKTTNGGSVWTPVVAPVQRDFNGVEFINADTGYIVGGNTNHRTILRTDNAGLNWTVVTDLTGSILNDISIADSTIAYAVGDSATVLKTIDGGLNWTPQVIDNSLSGNEQIRSVNFYDRNFGAIAGRDGLLYVYLGSPLPYTTFHTEQASALTYTLARLNATINKVTVPMNLFFEYDTTAAFTHSVQATPASVNDTILHHISSVVNSLLPFTVYYYRLKGVTGANTYYGNTQTFYTATISGPNNFETKTATEVTDSSAVLNGSINGVYFPTPVPVSFEYGTSENLGIEITAGTASLTDTLSHLVSAVLTGLSPDTTLYYYRLKVQVGTDTYFGDIRRLNTGTPEIPNWDFQNWQNKTIPLPADWTVIGNNMQQVPGHAGNYAIKISRQTALGNCRYVPLGGSGAYLYAGQPFHYRPDSLIFYADYNLVPGDSASVWVRLYSGNNTMANNLFYITGNSGSNFKRFSFPLSYSSSSIPDSLILAFFPINFFGSSRSDNPANFIALDDIGFLPAAPSVTNGTFENWFTYNFNELEEWNYSKYIPAGFSQGTAQPSIVRTLFAQPDDYAAEVQIYAYDGNFMDITLGFGNSNVAFTKGFAVNGRHQSFNGYYQYAPENADTMRLYVGMFNAGQKIGTGYYATPTPATSGFIPFDIPINYYPVTNLIPDSAGIEISAGVQPSKGASKIRIDKVSFDGLRKATIDSTVALTANTLEIENGIRVYPNPSKNNITIEWAGSGNENRLFQLMDLNGRLVKEILFTQQENLRINLIVAELESGFYFLRMQSGNKMYYRKIAVVK